MNIGMDATVACPQCEAQKALREAATLSPDRIVQLADELNRESTADPAIASVAVQALRRECCSACDALTAGAMCSWCGCYIALRARAIKATCPYPGNNKWSCI